jgi:hypothetical protein
MPTTSDYLAFSQLAYDLTTGTGSTTISIPSGWGSIRTEKNAAGLNAVAFKNSVTGEIVISYRGSASAYDWVVADGDIAHGKRPDVFDSGRQFAQGIIDTNPGASISVTGHSLGGATAQDVAAFFKFGGNTFGAPGVANLLGSGVTATAPGLINYVGGTDAIGSFTGFGAHIGSTVELAPQFYLPTLLPQLTTLIADFLLPGQLPAYISPFGALTEAASHALYTYGEALRGAGTITNNMIPSVGWITSANLTAVYNNMVTLFGKRAEEFSAELDKMIAGYRLLGQLGGALADNYLSEAMNGLKGFFGSIFGSGQLDTSTFNSAFNLATYTSPIILDLDGNGTGNISFGGAGTVDTLSRRNGTYFDLDNNGFAQRTGWVGGNDGLLVWDRNGNGKIDNAGELFGNNALKSNGSAAAHGFEVLQSYDTNADGKIDLSDTIWGNLRLWVDANHNGLTDTGELKSLASQGVQALNAANFNQREVIARNCAA